LDLGSKITPPNYGKIYGGNMETNYKNIFWLFQKKLKFGTSIVHTNMYSQEKVWNLNSHFKKFMILGSYALKDKIPGFRL
jgi:hypothetical protein